MATKTKKRNRHMPVSKAKNAYELLGEIRKLILEEPKRYSQNNYLIVDEPHFIPMPSCGTVGCVAGWTVALKGARHSMLAESLTKARDILGLDHFQARELFDAHAAGDVDDAQTKAHARAGAAHIARFMKEHKAQLKAKAV